MRHGPAKLLWARRCPGQPTRDAITHDVVAPDLPIRMFKLISRRAIGVAGGLMGCGCASKAVHASTPTSSEAGPPQTPATGAKADRRASAKHMALDAEVLNSLSLQLKEEGNEIAF